VTNKIKGGYYIKARCIQDAEIAKEPPYIREIWDWLLKECNHADNDKTGLKRGQCLRTYRDIQEGLCWYIGWRKVMYNKWQCEIAMKRLKATTMITTQKTTRGILITVVKYNFYQDANNYDSHTITTDYIQSSHTINKNDKNDKNDKNQDIPAPQADAEVKTQYLDFVFLKKEEYDKLIEQFGQMGADKRIQTMNDYAHQIGAGKFKKRYVSHYHTLLNWARKDSEKKGQDHFVPKALQVPEDKYAEREKNDMQ
jgi:hypothetical protein